MSFNFIIADVEEAFNKHKFLDIDRNNKVLKQIKDEYEKNKS